MYGCYLIYQNPLFYRLLDTNHKKGKGGGRKCKEFSCAGSPLYYETASLLLVDALKSIQGYEDVWPAVNTEDVAFLHEVIDHLEEEEIMDMMNFFATEGHVGVTGCVHSAKQVTEKTPIHEDDPKIKWLMNLVNARPKGWKIELSGQYTTRENEKMKEVIKQMRKKYFPKHFFSHMMHVKRGMMRNSFTYGTDDAREAGGGETQFFLRHT